MYFKKDNLFKLIDGGNLNGFTVVGCPKEELVLSYFDNSKNYDNAVMDLFKKYDIENELGKFDHTDINIYFPESADMKKTYVDICSITFKNKYVNSKSVDKCIKAFLSDTYDYYETDLIPYYFNKIINSSLSFEDMLMLIPDSQENIAKKINKSSSLISDMKNGRCKVSIDTLASLMKAYPLLPWDSFISNFSPNKNQD